MEFDLLELSRTSFIGGFALVGLLVTLRVLFGLNVPTWNGKAPAWPWAIAILVLCYGLGIVIENLSDRYAEDIKLNEASGRQLKVMALFDFDRGDCEPIQQKKCTFFEEIRNECKRRCVYTSTPLALEISTRLKNYLKSDSSEIIYAKDSFTNFNLYVDTLKKVEDYIKTVEIPLDSLKLVEEARKAVEKKRKLREGNLKRVFRLNNEQRVMDMILPVYYLAKNRAFQNQNHFTELREIEARSEFSRSLFALSLVLLGIVLILGLVRFIVDLFLSNPEESSSPEPDQQDVHYSLDTKLQTLTISWQERKKGDSPEKLPETTPTSEKSLETATPANGARSNQMRNGVSRIKGAILRSLSYFLSRIRSTATSFREELAPFFSEKPVKHPLIWSALLAVFFVVIAVMAFKGYETGELQFNLRAFGYFVTLK